MPKPRRWRAPAKTLRRALYHRSELTRAEDLVWRHLRRDALGVHFRRQHPIGPFILDFVCLSLRLVVEIDDDSHDARYEHDERRTRWLAARGFRVIRYDNAEVYEGLLDVIEDIEREVLRRREERE